MIKDIGFVDVLIPFALIFTVMFGVLDKVKVFKEKKFNAVIAILKISPLIFILGLIGMIFLYIDNKKTIFYPIVLLFIPLIYIASVIFLPKHFLFFNTIMIIPASYLIEKIIIKFNQIEKKIIFSLIILIIVLHALLLIQHPFYLSKAPINQIMEDTNQFEKDSVIIVDPRLYTGQMHWIFYTLLLYIPL